MNEKTKSLLSQIKFGKGQVRNITFAQRSAEPQKQQPKAEYFVDLVAKSNVPDTEISHNVRKHFDLNDDWRMLPFDVDDIQEAVTIVKEFSESLGVTFTSEDEERLKREKDKGRGYKLFIFERVA